MQNAEHHRERFELAYATEWAKAREGNETPEQLASEVKTYREGDTYEAGFPRLRFGWEGYQWALAGRSCLAQIQEPAQPVAEICSASGDGAEFGERNIKLLCDISGFEYGTPLYAGAAPAAVAPQDERQWICPTRTVADLVNNLLTMDQALPIYGAQYIERDGRRCAIAVPPTVSRERVKDGRWIGQGEELNAAVVWTRAEQPAAAPGLTDGQLDDESYRVNDEPGFSDAFRAGARFAERVHGVTASAARAVTGKADWWRRRADEIEVQVARSGSQEAMRCYTDMRTLLQAAAPALEAPAAPAIDVSELAISVCQRVAELPDRNSPEDWPDAMLVTIDELGEIVRDEIMQALNGSLAAAPQAPAEAQAAPVAGQCRFKGEQAWGNCSVEHVRMILQNPSKWQSYEVRYLYAVPQAPAAPAEAVELDMDRVLALADEHADESREDGVRLLNRGGLLALAKDVLRIFSPEAAPALSTEPLPVMPRAITTGLGIDDSGEEPAYCIMAAFRQEDDARYALSILSAGIEAQAAPAAPAVDAPKELDPGLSREVYRACEDLPEGWSIRIDLENGYGSVKLIDPDGEENELPVDGWLSDAMRASIAAAQAAANGERGRG